MAIVVAPTFRGATVLKEGGAVALEFHPLDGPMRLILVSASDVSTIEELAKSTEREKVAAIVAKGTPCSAPFDGTRSLPEVVPYDEVRLAFTLSFEGTACSAKLVRTEHLAKDGSLVNEGPRPASPVPSPSPPPVAPKQSPAAPPVPVSRACGGCGAGGEGPAMLLLALSAVTSIGRRRRAP
jgi:hypothetical protein